MTPNSFPERIAMDKLVQAHQDLLAVRVDCDRDTLRFTVRQAGAGFCHRATAGCWGGAQGLAALELRPWW